MPQLGLGLGAQINESNSFDPDALRYFATAGVTDATGRSQINTFVRGIKSLGLYNNMVAWPLRSTQNAGTGVTAYSLGGLGTFDGTLTNGPTWGTSGIAFDGTDDYLLTTFTTGLSELTAFSVATPSSKLSLQLEMAKDNNSTAREWGLFTWNAGLQRSYVFNSTQQIVNGPAHQTTIRSMCMRASASVNKLRRNNESDSTGAVGTLTQSTNPIGIASSSIGERWWFQGTIHASILFNTALTDSQTSAVYYLYQSTLGADLGLPDQTFARDFATNKTLNHGTGPNISFVRASAANYFNSAGVLTSAAVDVPRFDHDPVTLESKGLLVEVQRTNLALRSAEFSDAAWNKTIGPVTVTADQIAAPDGTTSADLIAATTDNDDHFAVQTISGATAVAYTMSIFVKQGTQRYIILGDRGDAVWRFLTFDFNTLSISGTTNLTSSSVTSVGNGWYRLTATATRTNTGSYQIFVGFSNVATSSTPPTYAASASDNFYAWGAQLEVGAFATSYIGTAGASATRSSDLPTVTPIDSFYNQNEGTIFVQQSQAVINHTTSFRFLEISNSSGLLRKPFLTVDTENLVVCTTLGGVNTANINSSAAVSANTVYKVICAYASNNFRGALNGTLMNLDTTVDVATPVVDRMTLGHSTSIPSQQISCHIQKVEYYPTRITDARMQSLTT
jgi:hypothetical protein